MAKLQFIANYNISGVQVAFDHAHADSTIIKRKVKSGVINKGLRSDSWLI